MACFITLEGGEGAGKSTQARRLATWLRGRGLQVQTTREPGGTPGAELLRRALLSKEVEGWDPVTEALIVTAARRDHVERLIRPSLAAGVWVVCDRFVDSTVAYQGHAGGLDLGRIAELQSFATDGLQPDLTIVLDLPPERGLARAGRRDGALVGRFEERPLDFHRRLRAGFLEIAAHAPQRCVVIDADRGEDAVAADLIGIVTQRLAVP